MHKLCKLFANKNVAISLIILLSWGSSTGNSLPNNLIQKAENHK